MTRFTCGLATLVGVLGVAGPAKAAIINGGF